MKAAVIGAGRIARQHLACVTDLANVELAAVCDLSPVAAEAAAERYGAAEWFTDHEAMLAACAPDVVHITTPVGTHARLASDAVRAGAHVVVEKPVARDLAELEALLELAREAGRHVVEDHNYLFNAQTRQLLEMRDSGELGDVVAVGINICLDITGPGSVFADPNLPHPALSLPGGAILDFVTHLASLAHAFVGPHRAVSAVWDKRRAGSPLPADELRVLVSGERATATLGFSSAAAPDRFELIVEGTRLRAETNLFETGLVLQRARGGGPLQPVANGLAAARGNAAAAVGGLLRKLRGGPGSYEGLWELLRLTYDAFAAGRPPPVGEREILEVNRLVAAIVDERNAL